ncbi:synaptic vesicle 2-related protein-like [Dendronephthya gigantea]|uniref:synaptic vesicle 2-related protein-like n=1 Tax=Dendronephthya gigantea TaxID=151771 RepID=UPI00106AC9CE|nr:synaptic vesicle 2-related protein-like [Dendronephthya gigantea]
MDLRAKLKQLSQFTRRSRASSETRARQSSDDVKYKPIDNTTDNDASDVNGDLFKSRSIDDILDDIGLRFFHFKAFVILGLLNMTDSLELSMLSVILPNLKSMWNISSLLTGILTFALSAGLVVGSPLWGWVTDTYGRKRGFIGSSTFIIVFAIASAFSFNYYWLWMSLFFVGFGVAAVSQIYVMSMELFPPKYRSIFSTLNSVFWTLGFLISSLVSIKLSVIGYRWALAIVCFPTAIFLVCVLFLPDSPHYHLAAGNEQKALDVLQDFAPEMDLSCTTLSHGPELKRADITRLFRSGYWKITTCLFVLAFTSMTTYYAFVFTASDMANVLNNANMTIGAKNTEIVYYSSGYFYSIMAWMNLPELAILFITALGCHIFSVKYVVLALFALAIMLQIVALFLVSQRTALLIVTMLSRSLLMSETTALFIYASLLYPTENRGIGVGTCLSGGRMGTLVGPFIFETLFERAYHNGIVFSIGILLLGSIATALLPSHSATLS